MFRQESLLHGQDEYYLTTLESVIEFIQNLSETYRTNLKLEPGEDFPSELDQWMWSEPQPSAPDADTASGKGASSHQQVSLDEMLSGGAPQKKFGEDPSLLTDTDEV